VLDAHFTPRNCRSTRAGDTATGGSAPSSPRPTRSHRSWLFHHKPGRSDQALAGIREQAQKTYRATDTASEETTIDESDGQ
jgi:hypothetical protein